MGLSSFVAMLNSGRWTDRNKAGWLLLILSQRRDPGMLARLRAQALDSLIEMARWRNPGHADSAKLLLGRIAGIPERHLAEIIHAGKTDEILGYFAR